MRHHALQSVLTRIQARLDLPAPPLRVDIRLLLQHVVMLEQADMQAHAEVISLRLELAELQAATDATTFVLAQAVATAVAERDGN